VQSERPEARLLLVGDGAERERMTALARELGLGEAARFTGFVSHADVVRDGENGLLVPPGDETALAEAVGRLLADESLRERLGWQAREDAVRYHSWEQYLSRLEAVLVNAGTA
jgi:glycosyltransferase involved in cell wall biosynthesis